MDKKASRQGKGEVMDCIKSLPLDGTADTEYCDCDKVERDCWWYLPVSIGFVVLAYAIGWVCAIWSITP